MFTDRTDAGEQLADALRREDVQADIVLGIPRGALPVAGPVAAALDVPLDVVVGSKIGAPTNPELAIGAVASDGSVWYNEDLIDRLDVSEEYVDRERRDEAEYAREKSQRYRGEEDPPDLTGKRVVIVDDGIATGATARACLAQVHEAGADRVVLAVPVGSPDTVAEFQEAGEQVVALEQPRDFRAVGQFYERFGQVSDEAAMTYLDGSGE